MPHRRSFRLPVAALIAAAALVLTAAGAAAEKPPTPIDDSALNPTSDRFHAVGPNIGARTIQFWTGQATNPVNSATYTYRMVGADPASNDAATIGVDIVPIDLNVGGMAFNASDVIPAVLASPLFQTGNYSSTTAASTKTGGQGSGGELSAGGVDVQYLDAIMRSQFNKVGSDYHLYLSPVVRRAVTLTVPAAVGTTLVSPRFITYGAVDETWFQPIVEGWTASLHYLQPHRLALFITDDVLLYSPASGCCVFGAHGTADTTAEGNGSDGRQSLQTFAWASWMTAGFYKPSTSWVKQDINGLSHEIAEWAADPFMNNFVQPWSATGYGCSDILETGDPVVGQGFTQGSTSFDQNIYSDGHYHPQDEVFLPWFMRTSPNDVSQPTQSDPSVGRYTFLGDLNGIWRFRQPPPSC